MGYNRCSIPGCNVKYGSGLMLRGLPKCPSLSNRWLAVMPSIPHLKNIAVCERHFAPSQFEKQREDGRKKLKADAVPFVPDRVDPEDPVSRIPFGVITNSFCLERTENEGSTTSNSSENQISVIKFESSHEDVDVKNVNVQHENDQQASDVHPTIECSFESSDMVPQTIHVTQSSPDKNTLKKALQEQDRLVRELRKDNEKIEKELLAIKQSATTCQPDSEISALKNLLIAKEKLIHVLKQDNKLKERQLQIYKKRVVDAVAIRKKYEEIKAHCYKLKSKINYLSQPPYQNSGLSADVNVRQDDYDLVLES